MTVRATQAIQRGVSLRWAVLLRLFLVFWAISWLRPLAYAELPEPPLLKAHVTDTTGTLTTAQIATLENSLIALEREKGSQVAILIVKTTSSEPIESFGLRVAEKNRLGRSKVTDGILLLVAKDDRAVRIEVGYGLEGVISDVISKRIIEEQILPRFRDRNFFGGISAGVDSISALIRGEALPPSMAQSPGRKNSISDLLFIAAFVCVGIGGALKSTLGSVPGSAIGGLLCGVVGFLASGVGLAIALLFIGFLFTLLANPASRGFRSRGGWSSGGWSGGGGGGGWSGGGGSFGGGGASGRW